MLWECLVQGELIPVKTIVRISSYSQNKLENCTNFSTVYFIVINVQDYISFISRLQSTTIINKQQCKSKNTGNVLMNYSIVVT